MIKKLSLHYSFVYCYNGAQRYEQFLQVGRLYQALISLGLALYYASASISSIFAVLYSNFWVTSSPFSEPILVGLALDAVDIVLQC